MERTKVLIVDDGEEYCQTLAHALGEHYRIRICTNGARALDLMQSFRPDILILDLMLQELDGLTLLQMAYEKEIRPKVLVTAYYFSPYTHNVLSRLQVDYSMRKPCSIQAMVCRVADLAAKSTADTPASDKPEDLVATMLLNMGFAPHLDGFRYLQTAITVYRQDTSQAITKELYVAVAKVHNKDPRQVERSIRSAIEITWKRSSCHQLTHYFAPAPDGSVPRPSNGRFIAHMTQQMKTQQLSA